MHNAFRTKHDTGRPSVSADPMRTVPLICGTTKDRSNEAALWSRTLTADEVAELYTLGMQGNSILPTSPKIPGDANNDGKVDGSDVTILAGNWQHGVTGTADATWTMGDFNSDGKVDSSDVHYPRRQLQYGVEAVAVAVPEPSTIALLISVLASLRGFLRRR